MKTEAGTSLNLVVLGPVSAAAIEPGGQVVPEIESSPVAAGRQSWTISTGRHKTFSIEHAHANDHHMIFVWRYNLWQDMHTLLVKEARPWRSSKFSYLIVTSPLVSQSASKVVISPLVSHWHASEVGMSESSQWRAIGIRVVCVRVSPVVSHRHLSLV